MSFKIVITKENNKDCVLAVPVAWESNGILSWPPILKKSLIEALRKNAGSIPETNWKRQKCRLKLNNIKTFTEAEDLEVYYSNVYTDDEETYKICRPAKSLTSNDMQGEDFNSYFTDEAVSVRVNEMVDNHPPKENTPVVQQSETAAIATVDDEQQTETVTQLQLDLPDIGEIKKQIEELNNETSRINVKLDRVLENQNTILDILRKLENKSIDYPTTHAEQFVEKYGFPLDSVEKMENLEKELMSKEAFENMVIVLSRISGTSGYSNINKAGLLLTKYMFQDEVLMKYTWRGVSGTNKLSFFQLHNIRRLIYKVLLLADSTSDAIKVDFFLQHSALKHSAQRLKRKLQSEKSATMIKKQYTNNSSIPTETEVDPEIQENVEET